MKLHNTFFVILFLMIFLVGCSQESAINGGYYKYSGDKMIEASFVKDAPVSLENAPYEPGEEIDIAVELINRLPVNIEPGRVRVRLTGDAAMPNFFEGAKEVTNPLLEGINPETGATNPEEIELGPIKYVGDIIGKVKKTITGQYCYSHPVEVKANLFYSAKAEDIGTNLPSNANPPSRVKITEIEQRPVDIQEDGTGRLKFSVTVANTGSGTVVDSLDDCFKYLGRRHKEQLRLTAKGAYDITCEKDGIVVLRPDTKSKTVNCEVIGIDPSNLGATPSELTLTLNSFAYLEEIEPVDIWLESS